MNIDTEEFDLLLRGLDALRGQAATGGFMAEMVTASLAPERKREELLQKLRHDRETKEEAQQKLAEDIDVLRGKLIVAKRDQLKERLAQ